MHATALIMSLKSHTLSVPLAFSGVSICFMGASLYLAFLHREPSPWFVSYIVYCLTYSQGAITPSQPCLVRYERQILGRGSRGGNLWNVDLEELHTSKITGCSETFSFTLTPHRASKLYVAEACVSLPSDCIMCRREPCLPFAFENAS